MKVKKLLLLIACFLSFSKLMAQDIQVTGKVLSAANTPLEGTTVSVKGTKVATATDKDGNYKISIPQKGGVLVFSYAGMASQEKSVKAAGTVNITMAASASSLEEVVVVGYGTQKKSVVTGAISSVRAKDLENAPNQRIEQSLQGRTPGVTVFTNSGQPGSPSTVRIRGFTTFGNSNPLWVVDGIVVDAGAIGFINQSDIESIEVLKDAASSAIYGTRAAGGLILITTKKGKQGKLTLSYNGFWGTSAPAKRLDLLNATEYATLMNERSVASGGNVVYTDVSKLGKGTDWQDAIFNTNANRVSHEISLSGGNERSQFFLSMNSWDQEGIVLPKISNYNKKGIRLNSTHKISKFLTIGQTFGFTHVIASGIGNTNSEYGGPLSSAINLDPTTPLIETDPALIAVAPYNQTGVIKADNGFPYGISSKVGQEMTNPLAYERTKYGNYGWSDDFVGNAYLEFNFAKYFKFKSLIGGKLAYWGDQNFTPVYYLNATNNTLRNSFGKSNNNVLNWTFENTLTFEKKFGDHGLTVLLGQGAYVDNQLGGGQAITVFDLPIDNWQDASFNFPVTEENRTSGAYNFRSHRLSSLFTRINYNYKEKYLFTGIYRRDGSTRFGKNYKYADFPGASIGWNIYKEDFWPSNKYVNSLKLRGGYGKTGNDANINEYQYLSTVSGGFNYTLGSGSGIITGYSPTTLDNPNLKWEQTGQTNIGFDALLLNSLTFTFDWYNKKTTGILRPVKVPGYVGVSESPAGNVADMKNTGIELSLGWNKKIGDFQFNVAANMATVKNKVLYVAADTNFIVGDAGFQSMGAVTRTQVGHSYNEFWGYQTAGIFQNQAEINAYVDKNNSLIQPDAHPGDFRWVDANGDGKINDLDKVFLGSNLPKVTFGFTVNVSYKGFDLMVFGQGAAGNKIFQGLRRLDIQTANYQTKAMSRWHGEGTSNDFPRLTNDDVNGNFSKMSDFYLEKGDYFRLKLVQLGYNVKHRIFEKIGLTKLRPYITAENLLTFTKYTGYDPEVGGGIFGVDKGFYPQARTFIIGVQVQF